MVPAPGAKGGEERSQVVKAAAECVTPHRTAGKNQNGRVLLGFPQGKAFLSPSLGRKNRFQAKEGFEKARDTTKAAMFESQTFCQEHFVWQDGRRPEK